MTEQIIADALRLDLKYFEEHPDEDSYVRDWVPGEFRNQWIIDSVPHSPTAMLMVKASRGKNIPVLLNAHWVEQETEQ